MLEASLQLLHLDINTKTWNSLSKARDIAVYQIRGTQVISY